MISIWKLERHLRKKKAAYENAKRVINRVITRSRRKHIVTVYSEKGAAYDLEFEIFTCDGKDILMEALKELGFENV